MKDRPTSKYCVDLRGLGFAPCTPEEVLEHISESLRRRRGGWLITANVDYLRRYVVDPLARALWDRADLVVADGVPLLWAARIQGTPLPGRVAGSDLVAPLAERMAREGRSLFLLGGDPGVAEEAARVLRERFAGLRIAGLASPWLSTPPRAEELAELREVLRRTRPDLVLVALGSPKTEHLIAALREETPESWWVGVGISLSFLTGHRARSPRWAQRLGLEWLHRLSQEPRRLARRYLAEDLPFVAGLLLRSLGRRLRCSPRRLRSSAGASSARDPSTRRS